MKKMHLAICDDEADIMNIVTGAIINTFRKYEIDASVETFTRTKQLEGRMREQEYDLIFLDIEMPGTDGITFARQLRKTNSRTDLIFISNREDQVFNALRVNPAGFIRKKRFLEDVTAVIDLWMQNRKEQDRNMLMIETASGSISVPIDRLLYVEGDGRYQHLHTSDEGENITVSLGMQKLEDRLTGEGFIRIHKGYLVNYRFIKRLQDTEALLTNGELLPMSRLRVHETRNRYLELMQNGDNIIL